MKKNAENKISDNQNTKVNDNKIVLFYKTRSKSTNNLSSIDFNVN